MVTLGQIQKEVKELIKPLKITVDDVTFLSHVTYLEYLRQRYFEQWKQGKNDKVKEAFTKVTDSLNWMRACYQSRNETLLTYFETRARCFKLMKENRKLKDKIQELEMEVTTLKQNIP